MKQAAILALLAAACGPMQSPAPCANCLGVGGVYSETAESKDVDCGDALQLSFTGGTGQTIVGQNGSALTIDGAIAADGVLNDDGSAIFGPIPATAQPLDSNAKPEPGKLHLAGVFVSSREFDGTYVFIADSNGCEIAAKTKLRR